MSGRERKGSDVLVVGGGAIGLACARALARGGRSVTVLDQGRPGAEATRAAGGMLSPLAEAEGPGPFLDLGLASLDLWPTFAAALRAETGVDVDLRADGKLLLALDEAAADRLRRRRAWTARAGFRTEWLEGEALRAREPNAARTATAGLHVERDGQVDNRLLGDALARAADAAGCRVRGETRVTELLTVGSRVRGVRTDDRFEHAADLVVIAAGAWTGTLGLPRPLPVRPIKGQMIALAAGSASPVTLLETDACYLIPRRSGSVWVGATSEDVGFSRGTDPAARSALRRAAEAAVPALGRAAETEAWDGFRPGTPDGLPVIGADPEIAGLVYATGHYRNGILLTPITAELVVACVDGPASSRLHPYRADRFADR